MLCHFYYHHHHQHTPTAIARHAIACPVLVLAISDGPLPFPGHNWLQLSALACAGHVGCDMSGEQSKLVDKRESLTWRNFPVIVDVTNVWHRK
jgi:hypothetical protein